MSASRTSTSEQQARHSLPAVTPDLGAAELLGYSPTSAWSFHSRSDR